MAKKENLWGKPNTRRTRMWTAVEEKKALHGDKTPKENQTEKRKRSTGDAYSAALNRFVRKSNW